MTLEVAAMMAAGLAAIAAGLLLARPRFHAAADLPGKILVLGPICEAAALAVFGAEHLTAARDIAPAVPHWLPAPLFWVYFFGVCLLAAALSFVIGRCVRWSSALLALFFLLVVLTVSLPGLPRHLHDHLFWPAFVREIAFASGALVLAASSRPRSAATRALAGTARTVLAVIVLFYAIDNFLYPLYTPGVPLEKLTPALVPAPVLWTVLTGIVLLLGGLGLLARPTYRLAAAGAGLILVLLSVFFYGPLFVAQFHSRAVEGLNYIFDTMLFASTILLAGLDPQPAAVPVSLSPRRDQPLTASVS